MDKTLRHFNKIYQNTHPPAKMESNGWQDLLTRIEEDEILRAAPRFPFPRYAFLFLAFLFVFSPLTYGFYRAARKSLPGTPLYPVRTTVESLVSEVSGNRQIIINERANDLVESTKSASPKNLDKSLEEYHKSLEKIKQEKERVEEEKQKMEDALKLQEETFRKLRKQIASSSAHTIEQALEAVKETRREIGNGKKEEKKEKD